MTSDELLLPVTIRALWERAGMRPSRAAGQHYLTSASTLAAILRAVAPSVTDTIVEVGAGFGVLTTALAERVRDNRGHEDTRTRGHTGRIIAIEREHRVVPILREIVAPYANVEVIERDVLALLRKPSEYWALEMEHWKLAANLPYGITSDFLRYFFDAVGTGMLAPPDRAVLLLQREVVDRMVGATATDRGFLSILVQLHCSVRRIAEVSSTHFWPPPRVDSAVAVLDQFRSSEAMTDMLAPLTRASFLRCVQSAFAHPRRQLSTCLRTYGETPAAIERACAAAGVAASIRPAVLTFAQWVTLARFLCGQS